jgi:hypothetical protein
MEKCAAEAEGSVVQMPQGCDRFPDRRTPVELEDAFEFGQCPVNHDPFDDDPGVFVHIDLRQIHVPEKGR